jgi:hypothetical protein
MALFKITVKKTKHSSGISLGTGMSVEVVSASSNPLVSNTGQHQIAEAFERKYGIDIKKAGGLSSATLDVEKM